MKRDYLIYMPVCAWAAQLAIKQLNPERTYDVFLNFYNPTAPNGEPLKILNAAGVKYASQQGHKWQMLHKNLYEGLLDASQYKYIFVIDPDIEFSFDFEMFFEYVSKNNLQICQPSLTKTSFASWGHTFTAGKKVPRRVKFCEIMMPCFRADVFHECYANRLFEASESGWGIDIIWGEIYENWVLDEFQAEHCRQVSSGDWKLENGLTPFQEKDAVVAHFNRIGWRQTLKTLKDNPINKNAIASSMAIQEA